MNVDEDRGLGNEDVPLNGEDLDLGLIPKNENLEKEAEEADRRTVIVVEVEIEAMKGIGVGKIEIQNVEESIAVNIEVKIVKGNVVAAPEIVEVEIAIQTVKIETEINAIRSGTSLDLVPSLKT